LASSTPQQVLRPGSSPLPPRPASSDMRPASTTFPARAPPGSTTFVPRSPVWTQDTDIPQDERFVVGVPAMQFPPVEGLSQIEYPVTDPAGNRLFLVCLQTMRGGPDEPKECVSIMSPDKQRELATCCVHVGPGMGPCECHIFNGCGDTCGILREDVSAPAAAWRSFAFHPDLSRGSSEFAIDVLTIRGNPRTLRLRILQGETEVIADCAPGDPSLGPALGAGPGNSFYQIACRGRADIGLSVLMLLGIDRIVARDGL
jgi:hypothetical protein